MKSTAVDESLSNTSTDVLFQRIPTNYKIKESIFIMINNPTLNRNIGKFNLPHIWDRVLLKTPGLNLKRHVHAVGHVNSNNSNTPI